MTAEERLRQSEAVCSKLMSHSCWQEANVVLLYNALPDEVDTSLLVETAVVMRKKILLPVVVGDDLELRVFGGRLKTGAYGIQEPTDLDELFVDFEKIDLAVVPGMAFDKVGHRLGRGKGYYDKLLCQCTDLYKIGLCFDFQLLEDVPAEEHDIVMDEVLSF